MNNIFRLEHERAMRRLSESTAQAGASMYEAIEAFKKFCGHLTKAVAEIASVTDIIERHRQPTDEELRDVATGKEWHYMKNAKKHRTRKKYRNRLIKRYHEEIPTERRTKS